MLDRFVSAAHVRVGSMTFLLATCVAAAACALMRTGSSESDVRSRAEAPRPGHALYQADLNLDLAEQSMAVLWKTSYVADTITSRVATYHINRSLTVERVDGPTVRSFRAAPIDEQSNRTVITVTLDPTVAPGDVVTLRMRYSGRPTFEEQHNIISEEWVELNLDGGWHPYAATFDQHLTGVLRVDLPEGWQVVSSGSGSYANGAHVVRADVPQVDVAFVAAPRLSRQSGEYFTVYYREATPEAVNAILTATNSCARYLNMRYGARDSLQAGRVVLADRPEVGYARKNYVVLSRFDPNERVSLERFVCHELAHFWSVSADFMSPHHWMSEAFAELVSARYIRETHGADAHATIVKQWEDLSREHGPVWTPDSERRPNAMVMYRRAPFILHQLEQRMGTESFERFLTSQMTSPARTTPELIDLLRRLSGDAAAEWLRDELARPPAQ